MSTMRYHTGKQSERRQRRGGAVLMVTVLLGITAACGPVDDMNEEPEMDDMSNVEAAMVTDEEMAAVHAAAIPDTLIDAALVGMGDESEVEGRAMVLWRAAEEPLELVVEAAGLASGDHAWDIHAGSCTTAGPVALELSEMTTAEGVVGPLLVDQTGMVDITIEVPELAGMVPSDGRYTLHVHEGEGIVHGEDAASEPVTVACALL